MEYEDGNWLHNSITILSLTQLMADRIIRDMGEYGQEVSAERADEFIDQLSEILKTQIREKLKEAQ